jgi:hypothetical protein
MTETTTRTHTVNLLPLQLVDRGIQLTEIEIFDEPRLPLAVVFYTVDGVEQEYGLRLDFGKMAFLDIDPFESDQATGRDRANALAVSIVKHLAQPQTRSAATYGD